MDYLDTDADPFYDSACEPDEAAFLRQEPVSQQVMATAGWLLAVALACLAALVTLACQQ